jgi:hypothetical protein
MAIFKPKKRPTPLKELSPEVKTDMMLEIALQNQEAIKNMNGWLNWFGLLSVISIVLYIISIFLP